MTANSMIVDNDGKKNYSVNEIRNRVIFGDAISVLEKMEANSVDMVFIDPPYFLQLGKNKLKRWNKNDDVKGVDDKWDEFDSFDEYDSFIEKVLMLSQKVMKPTATFWIIGSYHNIFRVGKIMQDLEFWMLNDVTWVKSNPMPNWLGVRFTNATETLIWSLKNKDAKGYEFNRDKAKEYGIGKVAANVWVIPVCTGKQRLKDEDGIKVHSAQKPVELMRRIIEISTKEGDIILDPMAGVGTTGAVAKKLNRDFVMIENNETYALATMERLKGDVELKKVLSPMEKEIQISHNE